MKVKYRPLEDSDKGIISEFIQNLYNEDKSARLMSEEKISKTFHAFTSHPDKGCILVIEKENIIAGYSILINFWSNEFGGNIIFIDELYIRKEFRGQNIATDFIEHLSKNKTEDTVALMLQVTPDNLKARKLYERLGFILNKNDTLMFEV